MSSLSYGGSLRKKRAGRGARPLRERRCLHLVLKSSQARGRWAFNRGGNRAKVEVLVRKFAERHQVRVHRLGNAGNHLHLFVRFTSIAAYRPFIRGLTAALAMAITGHSRWRKVLQKPFFDFRPFSRVVAAGLRAFRDMDDYVLVNALEGFGLGRKRAQEKVGYRRLVLDGFFGPVTEGRLNHELQLENWRRA